MHKYKLIAGLIGLTCFLAGAASAQTASSIAQQAERGQRIPAWDVAQIYSNRTWLWKDGAGYFRQQKRQFTGWSGTGKAAAYGEGVWFLKENGTICFRAKWTSGKKSSIDHSCFEHRRLGNTIYAKNTTKGDWYILAGGDKKSYQEIRMLKKGDRVSKRVQEIKSSRTQPTTQG